MNKIVALIASLAGLMNLLTGMGTDNQMFTLIGWVALCVGAMFRIIDILESAKDAAK